MSAKIQSIWDNLLKIHEKLCESCFWIGAIILFLIAFTTSYEVAVRYFFNRPTSWAIDFGEYFLLYSTFLTLAWILKLDGHIKVTLIQERLGTRSRLTLDIVNSFIGAIACGVLTVIGVIETRDIIFRSVLHIRPVTIPKWIVMWIVPFGLFLFCTYFLRTAFSLISQLRSLKSTSR